MSPQPLITSLTTLPSAWVIWNVEFAESQFVPVIPAISTKAILSTWPYWFIFIVGTFDEITGYGLFSGIFLLLSLIPNISVGVRRLHDTDRSGWWLLLGIIPLVGLVLLVFFCLNGTTGENRFGPDPKADANEINFW